MLGFFALILVEAGCGSPLPPPPLPGGGPLPPLPLGGPLPPPGGSLLLPGGLLLPPGGLVLPLPVTFEVLTVACLAGVVGLAVGVVAALVF